MIVKEIGVERCEKCQSSGPHLSNCELKPDSEKLAIYEELHRSLIEKSKNFSKLSKYYSIEITAWKGRNLILKEENNQLRKNYDKKIKDLKAYILILEMKK